MGERILPLPDVRTNRMPMALAARYITRARTRTKAITYTFCFRVTCKVVGSKGAVRNQCSMIDSVTTHDRSTIQGCNALTAKHMTNDYKLGYIFPLQRNGVCIINITITFLKQQTQNLLQQLKCAYRRTTPHCCHLQLGLTMTAHHFEHCEIIATNQSKALFYKTKDLNMFQVNAQQHNYSCIISTLKYFVHQTNSNQ